MTTDLTLTFSQIITKALKRLAVFEEGDTMTAHMFNSAVEDINLILKGLRRYGRHLFLLEQITKEITVPDVVTHNSETYYCLLNHTSETAVIEPGVSDGWENYWYASDVFSADVTPVAWVDATAYVNGADFDAEDGTARIEFAFIREDDEDYEIALIDRFQRANIESKWQTGRPETLYFDRYATPATIRLNYLPDKTYYLFYTRIRTPEDYAGQGEVPDVPIEWVDYLIYALAAKQGEEYDIDHVKLQRLEAKANAELALNLRDQVESSDDTSIHPAY